MDLIYFFENKDNINKLKQFLNDWHGTPYKHYAGTKGLECDCIHLIYRGCQFLGIKVPNKISWYDSDWHLHNKDELLLKGLRKYLNADEVAPDNPRDGDIITYKFGHTTSHAGWFLDNHVYQALFRIGVQARTWNDRYWHKRRSIIFRILNNE